MGDVLLPLTEFQNRIPKCHRLLVEAITCLFSSPYSLSDRLHSHWAAAWSPKAGQVPAQLYKPCRQSAGFKSWDLYLRWQKKELLTEGTLVSVTVTEQLCVPPASVQHPQSPVSIDSAQCREQPAYSQQCKLLTKPVLLAGHILCILPSLYLKTSRDRERK